MVMFKYGQSKLYWSDSCFQPANNDYLHVHESVVMILVVVVSIFAEGDPKSVGYWSLDMCEC